MALNNFSSWSYYSGTNAQIYIDNILVGETVAIEYKLYQNRQPLYGYNAPLFNAVADGQVLVQGSLAINYVIHDYLLSAIQATISSSFTPSTFSSTKQGQEIDPTLDPEVQKLLSESQDSSIIEDILLNSNDTIKIETLKKRFWNKSTPKTSDYNFAISSGGLIGRPDQNSKSIDIVVYLGNKDSETTVNKTKHILKDVYFKGRAMGVAITEDPLVESFEFFARNLI